MRGFILFISRHDDLVMLIFFKLLQVAAVQNPPDRHREPEGKGAGQEGGGEGHGFVHAEGNKDQCHGALKYARGARDDRDHREEF